MGLVVTVALLVVAATAVWIALGFDRSAEKTKALPNLEWTPAMHESFEQECVRLLTADLAHMAGQAGTDPAVSENVARFRLVLQGACSCVHQRLTGRVPHEEAKAALFGNAYAQLNPYHKQAKSDWEACLRSNKDSIAPTSPDALDFRGAVDGG